jgi:hypothetical protein
MIFLQSEWWEFVTAVPGSSRAVRKMMEHLNWEQARKAKLPGKWMACQILDGRVMAAVN